MLNSGSIERSALYLGIVDSLLGIAIFFHAFYLAGMGLELSILTAALVFAVIIVAVAIDWKTSFHSKILGPARKRALFALASLVVDEWNLDTNIDSGGNGDGVHEVVGHVNFGKNRWLTLGIETDTEQLSVEAGQFPIKVTDLVKNEPLSYKVLLDEPRYKRVNIFFGQVLKRGDKFRIKIEYRVIGTYFFNKPDKHVHRAYHWEKKVNFSVTFKGNIRVEWARGLILTENGDVWREHPEAQRHNDHFVTWSVDKAGPGNSHILEWMAKMP